MLPALSLCRLVEMKEAIQDINYQVIEKGGIASPKGFVANGVCAGFKLGTEKPDLALILADEACPSAAVFTKSAFCAAPVQVSREHLDGKSCGYARAIIMNSGNANAATGNPGIELVRTVAAESAKLLGCEPKEILLASTGVIGAHIPLKPFTDNLSTAINQASQDGGYGAACAIMTTDTVAKEYAITYISESTTFKGTSFTVGGIAKGSGMIMPDMATMLAALTTDAPLSPDLALKALRAAVGKSFNKVTVDSDTSTNDTCFLMASGKAATIPNAREAFQKDSIAFAEFLAALEAVCIHLARQIALDGEGATRLITINLNGAASDEDADKAARAVANSPLVKTAIYGHDANWGRIAMALGHSGAAFSQEKVSIDLMGIPVCRDGLTVPFDEEEALRRFEAPEVVIDINLGAGNAATTLWTCDFTHDYITINGDYRT